MHHTAMKYGRYFFEKYVKPGSTIAEIGSMIVANQDKLGFCLRAAAPEGCIYIGVDQSPGPGVDCVAHDPYKIPLHDDYADAVVSSSTLEHSPMFWMLFLEMCRIAKPGAALYISVPSNGYVHRHPVDCWRFYPDAHIGLTEWAERYGYKLELIESFVGEPDPDIAHWEDFVAIWRKAK